MPVETLVTAPPSRGVKRGVNVYSAAWMPANARSKTLCKPSSLPGAGVGVGDARGAG